MKNKNSSKIYIQEGDIFSSPLPSPDDPVWKEPPPVVPPPVEPEPPINQDDPKPPPFVPPAEPPVVTPPVEDVPVEEIVEELSDAIACPDDTGQVRGFTVNPPGLSECDCQDEILMPAFTGVAAILKFLKYTRIALLAHRSDEVGDVFQAILGMKKNLTTRVDDWIEAYNKTDDVVTTSFVDDALRIQKLSDPDATIRSLRQVTNAKIIASQNEAKQLIADVRPGSAEFKSIFKHHHAFGIEPKWNSKLKQYELDPAYDRTRLGAMYEARVRKWADVDKLPDAEVDRRAFILINALLHLTAGTAKSNDYMGLANTSIEFKLSRIRQLEDTIKIAEKNFQQSAKEAVKIAQTYKHAWDEELVLQNIIDLDALKESGNPMRLVVHRNVPMTRKEFIRYLDELKEINVTQRQALGAELKGLARAKQQGGVVYKEYIKHLAIKYTTWAALIGGLLLDLLNVLKFTEKRVCWTNPQNDSSKTEVDFDNDCQCRKCPENSQLCEHDQFKWSRSYTSGQLPLGVTLPNSRTQTELNQCVKNSACPPGREVVNLSTYKLLWDENVPNAYDRKPCACWCKDREHTNRECNKQPGKQLPKNPDYTDSFIPFADGKGGIVCAERLPPDGKSETSWFPWAKSAWHWDKDKCGYVCKNGNKPEDCAVDGLGILAEGEDPWDLFDVEKCECYGESLLQNLVP